MQCTAESRKRLWGLLMRFAAVCAGVDAAVAQAPRTYRLSLPELSAKATH